MSVPDRQEVPLRIDGVALAAGEKLALVYGVDGMFIGAGCTFPKLRLVIGRADTNALKH